jgi:hypothetical protein
MSNNDWFRVPLFLPTLEADEQHAWIAVLGRWHTGGHFGNRELRRLVGQGGYGSIDRVSTRGYNETLEYREGRLRPVRRSGGRVQAGWC